MKNQLKKAGITACFALFSGMAMAQLTTPIVPPPPAGAGKGEFSPPAGSLPGRPEGVAELKTLTAITGTISAYLTNDRYAYNGLTLRSGSQSITVRFSEQLGQILMNAAKKGEQITVKGFTDRGPDGVSIFHLVSATAGNTQIVETPPVQPAQAMAAESRTYSGSLREFKRDQDGRVTGLNLDNKVWVDLPPHTWKQLQPLLKTGEKIEVSGFKDTPASGVVLAANAPSIIHPQTITIGGQTYLLR